MEVRLISDDNDREPVKFTALQFAVKNNLLDQVKYLLESDEFVDINRGPDTALHLSLRRHNVDIALILIKAGADFELKDSHGDLPIHIACVFGLLEIVRSLCNLGCNLEIPNSLGYYPLHLAAKNGHISIVRCLCIAGCNINVKNFENIRADVTAVKYGHNDVAELLDRLRVTGQRDNFARQLVPNSKPILRVGFKILGNCGVGKSSLIKSLNAGIFSSFFKRSSSLQSNKSRPSSPNTTQIEMDVTSSRQSSLSFESTANYQSTNGINVQTLDISNVGEVTVWEFSGQECYFPIYHHFLRPSPYAVTAIVFNLNDPFSVQLQQVSYWLNFLLARQPADLPTSEYGPVLLIATHVDLTRAVKTQQGEWICPDALKIFENVKKCLPHVPNFSSTVIVMDANVPASFAFKQLKNILAGSKQECIRQTIGTWTGLLENTLQWIKTLQQEYEHFPVVTHTMFAELLRTQINVLTSDDHVSDLLKQLETMGEIFRIKNFIILSINWLGTRLLGELLSYDFMRHARVTGVYTSEDFQANFNQCDALAVLDLLHALDVCIQCEIDGEIEYEFPLYNQIETLEGLWVKYEEKYTKYCGYRLYTSPGTYHLLKPLFYNVQIELRRSICINNDIDTDLYQWHFGSKLCTSDMESLITLEHDDDNVQFIEIKIRSPDDKSVNCFYFSQQILITIDGAIFKVCPGLIVEKHVLSPLELQMHSINPYCYESKSITLGMLEVESTFDLMFYNPNLDVQESIIDLIMFGDASLVNTIQWGCALKVQSLPSPVKLKLCGLLDPPDKHGRDWCLLALKLGLNQEKIAALDSQHSSHTMRLLTTADCSIGALISSLHELDRFDVEEVILRSTPIFQVLLLEHAV